MSIDCFRGMGEGRRELHLEEMGERTSVKSRDTDSMQQLLDRPRHRTRIHSANIEAFPRHTHVPVAAKEQAEEELELLAGDEGVLQGRTVHQFRRHRLERLDPPSERISRLLLPWILFFRSLVDHQWISLQ